jgi:nitroreductase
MKVSEAMRSRRSTRQFLDKPVPRALVQSILTEASRAPSNSNLQPWKVYVLAGQGRARLVAAAQAKFAGGRFEEPFEYAPYPKEMREPYLARRDQMAEAQYGAMGIARADHEGRRRYVARNFAFFGAPVGLIFTIDKNFGPGQWADVGMFIQSIMLLAREHGLHSCAQASWSLFPETVRRVLGAPASETVICGMALGYADEAAAINHLNIPRAPLEDFADFRHFDAV